MQRFLIHFLVLTLIGSGLVYAADSHGGTESHAPGKTELVSQTDSNHHDDGDHHAHHGCHLSVHLLGLTSEPVSFMPVDSRNSFTRLTKTYISRLSVPPSKPPRS